MAVRSALIDFSLANPIYAGATVSLFLVDPVTGAKSTTLANLYAAPTGAAALLNPQVLDSQGKWKQPVYFEDSLVAVVSGLSVGDHDTGIIHPDGSWRGDWVSGATYMAGDHFRDGVGGANTKNIMVVLVDHVAGTYAADLAAAKFELLIDVSDLEAARAAAQASASAAATSEVNAAASAVTAGLQATASATSAASSLSHANDAAAAQVAAEAARDATLAAYDSFDDRYLGPKASEPTTDNDGNPLIGGALFFDTSAGYMKLWTGAAWTAAYVSGAGYLAAANNLSDVANPATAFANIKQAATESASGVAEIATQAETDAGTDDMRFITALKLATRLASWWTATWTALKGTAVTLTKAWGYSFQPVAYNAGAPTWNVSTMPAGSLDMTSNPVIDATGIEDGKVYQLRIYHNGGARTPTFNATRFKWGDDGQPSFSATAGKYDYLTFVGSGTTELHHMGTKTGF